MMSAFQGLVETGARSKKEANVGIPPLGEDHRNAPEFSRIEKQREKILLRFAQQTKEI